MRVYPEWFIKDLKNEEDRNRARLGTLKSTDVVEFICSEGHVYKTPVSSHIRLSTGEPISGCRFCRDKKRDIASISSRLRKYPQWFIDSLVDDGVKELARSGELETSAYVDLKCDNGHVYRKRVNHVVNLSTGKRKEGCSICSHERHGEYYREIRKYPDWFVNSLVDEKDAILAENGLLKSKDIVRLKCSKGHIYSQVVSSAIHLSTGDRYEGCPQCCSGAYRSQMEKDIESYINSFGFETQHSRGIIGREELDIYIPSKKIAIEVNGSFYHSTLCPSSYNQDLKSFDYHQNKFIKCENKGIQLISIFDVDYNVKKELINRYLVDRLVKTDTVYARRCRVVDLDSKVTNIFYKDNHLLGPTGIQSVSAGLIFNDKLVSVMSFQRGRYKEDSEVVWCLTRFCSKLGLTVVGGASRLFSHLLKKTLASKVVSYSDNDYFTGSVYSKLGFKLIGFTSRPRYYWYLNGKEIKRESCQLSRLKIKYPELYEKYKDSSGNREDLIMLELGASKVYRSGNKKWIWTVS